MLAPKMIDSEQKPVENNTNKQSINMTPLGKEDQEKLNNKLNLEGIENWTEEQKRRG